ncbi:MAG: hypothetical protein GY793_00875 [Proteobacteria bacterium]|nr:hypothetical protein [Pseudomonadota bacterium]
MKPSTNPLATVAIIVLNTGVICWSWFEFCVFRRLFLCLKCLAIPEMGRSCRADFKKMYDSIENPELAIPQPMECAGDQPMERAGDQPLEHARHRIQRNIKAIVAKSEARPGILEKEA